MMTRMLITDVIISAEFICNYVARVSSKVALVVKNLPANAGNARDAGSIPGSGRSPGGGHGNPLQYVLPGESHGQRSLAGHGPRGCKESDTTDRRNNKMHTGV